MVRLGQNNITVIQNQKGEIMFAINIGQRFEQLTADILETVGFTIKDKDFKGPESGRRVDLIVEWKNVEYICEIKAYRTHRAQLPLLFSAAATLNLLRDELRFPGLLIVSCRVDEVNKKNIMNKFNVALIDIEDLYLWAGKSGEFSDYLISLFEIDKTEVDTFIGREVDDIIFNNFLGFQEEPTKEILAEIKRHDEGEMLITSLMGIESGSGMWREYEKSCQNILQYLFKDELKGWHPQTSTSDGLHRYDYICRISGTKEFWSFLVGQLNSRYVVFEFKNYTDKITQSQVLTTEKYLLENALRKVAIIICRTGCDSNAKKMIEGAMRESGKLIMVLTDEDMKKMIKLRIGGDDASDYLSTKVDDFLLKLPR